MKLHPSIRIIYILVVSVAIFVFNNLWVTLGLLGLQLLLWLILQIPLKKFKPLKKIWGFALALVFFYAFFSGTSDFVLFSIKKWNVEVALSSVGVYTGLFMVAKLVTMLLATFVVRFSTAPQQFMLGLQGLGLSKDFAAILDNILESVEKDGSKKKGKKKGKEGKDSINIKSVIKGNFSGIPELINQRLATAREKFTNSDVAIIAAFSMVVTFIRFMKIAPGFPIAPGHKNVLLIPFFILGARLTKRRFTGTAIGFLSGIIHFAAGFGKYGPLGILQFMLMGLVIDLLMLLFKRSNSVFIFGLIGGVAGLTRVSAEISLAVLLGMPVEYYLVYSPYILSQCIFGVLSAIVTKYLIHKIR